MKGTAVALLALVLWGACKLPWEEHLAARRAAIMHGQVPAMSFQLRDSLGQGLTLAALGGLRGVAANFIWISLTTAWENQQWTRVRTLAEFAVLLQPRVSFFWENGAWHLAWNASVAALNYPRPDTSPTQRERESRQWIEAGREMLERAIAANPEKYQLRMRLAELYQQRLNDHATAARYYMEASRIPGASPLAERFAGYALERAGRKQEAYQWWLQLWHSSSDHPDIGPRQWPKIRERIENLEKELNIPHDKRLFPK